MTEPQHLPKVEDQMTSRERSELAQLCRRREKLAKSMASEVAAVRLADFEAQLARQYSWAEEESWAEAMRIADEAVMEVNKRIAERLGELGVPSVFAPSAHLGWASGGENVSSKRRAELRKVGQTRIAAMEKSARTEIERASIEVQTNLVAGGLTSEDARRFLEAMPTADVLMPALDVPEIEKQLGPGR